MGPQIGGTGSKLSLSCSFRSRELCPERAGLAQVVDISKLPDQICCTQEPWKIVSWRVLLLLGDRKPRMLDVSLHFRGIEMTRAPPCGSVRVQTAVNGRYDTGSLMRQWSLPEHLLCRPPIGDNCPYLHDRRHAHSRCVTWHSSETMKCSQSRGVTLPTRNAILRKQFPARPA